MSSSWSRSSSSVRGRCATSPRSRSRRCWAAGSVGCCSTAAATRRSTARRSGTGATPARSRTIRPTPTRPSSTRWRARRPSTTSAITRAASRSWSRRAIGRIWDVYRPFQNVEFNDKSERRGHAASWAVLIGYWLVMPFAIFGLVVMRRRRIPIFPYFAIALSVTITVALSFGITRYRAPVDTVLPLLAAIGIDSIWRHRRPPAGDDRPTTHRRSCPPPRPWREHTMTATSTPDAARARDDSGAGPHPPPRRTPSSPGWPRSACSGWSCG